LHVTPFKMNVEGAAGNVRVLDVWLRQPAAGCR
jgi:hypothetical protein